MPGVAARRAQGRRPARPLHGRPREAALSPAGATGYPGSDEGDRGVLTAMATPFDEGGAVDHDAARRPGRAPARARLARAGRSPASTGECPTLTDEEEIELLRAVRAEVGDEVAARSAAPAPTTPATRCELTKMAADGRRRRLAGRRALLQQAQPGRHPRPLRGGRRGRPRAADGDVQHPLAGGHQHAARSCSPSWPRSTTSSPSSRPTTTSCGPIEGLDVLAGNDNTFLRVLEFGGAGGILVASHVVGDRRCARCGTRRRRATSTARARSTPS